MLTLVAIAGFQSHAQPVETKAKLALKMYSAFQRATFSELSKKGDEQARFFKIGYDAGKGFYEALEKGEISDEQLRSTVPLIINLLHGGPNIDFLIGRVFQFATDDAFGSVVKNDGGLPRKVDDWIMDVGLRKIIAENAYRKANCELLD